MGNVLKSFPTVTHVANEMDTGKVINVFGNRTYSINNILNLNVMVQMINDLLKEEILTVIGFGLVQIK